MKNRRCPACGHWRMYDLSNYYEEDINGSPVQEGWGSPSWFFEVNWFYYLGWLVNTLRGSAGVASRRAKLRRIRKEVLPRAPKSIICPNCFEVIERFSEHD